AVAIATQDPELETRLRARSVFQSISIKPESVIVDRLEYTLVLDAVGPVEKPHSYSGILKITNRSNDTVRLFGNKKPEILIKNAFSKSVISEFDRKEYSPLGSRQGRTFSYDLPRDEIWRGYFTLTCRFSDSNTIRCTRKWGNIPEWSSSY